MSEAAVANQQPGVVAAAKAPPEKPEKEPKPQAVTRTMDQIDRKLERHTPHEVRTIMVYLEAKWGVPVA